MVCNPGSGVRSRHNCRSGARSPGETLKNPFVVTPAKAGMTTIAVYLSDVLSQGRALAR